MAFQILVRCLLLIFFGFTLACADEGGLVVQPRSVDANAVDFGRVQVGQTVEAELTLRNPGPRVVRIETIRPRTPLSTEQFEFAVDADGVSLAPGQAVARSASFRPTAAGIFEVVVDVISDADDGPLAVALTGEGVADGLLFEPDPIEFGAVLVGTAKTVRLSVTNRLAHPVELTSAARNGRPAVSGSPTFSIDAAADDGFRLPMAAGETLGFDVTYRPGVAGPDRGTWTLATCPDPRCTREVRLFGRGTDVALTCTPALAFGAVNPGRVRTLTATCENATSAPVTITGWALSALTAASYGVEASGARALAAGETVDIDVAYAPALDDLGQTETGALDVRGETAGGRFVARVALEGEVGGPSLEAQPNPLSFETIGLGTDRTRRLVISNAGFADAFIFDLDPDRADTGLFSTPYRGGVLAVGTSTVIEVTYAPVAVGDHGSELIISSNDTARPELAVPLIGRTEDVGLCQYELSPPAVDFGVVGSDQTVERTVTFQNLGSTECLVNGIEVVAAAPANGVGAFDVPNGAERLRLAPGASHPIVVRYRPSESAIDRAVLTMYVSNPVASAPQVPLTGRPEPRVEALCPPPQTVEAKDTLTLTVGERAVASRITGYRWRVVPGQAPVGGGSTPGLWTPDPPTSATVDFTPVVVGSYVLEASLLNDLQAPATCTVPIDVTGRGLSVTLTWDGLGDVDLHLHNGLPLAPWFDGASDCHYANPTPIWDTAFSAATGPNPELDIDNQFGFGPENISIADPEVGRGYVVGVHHFVGAAGQAATVQVFCGAGTSPARTFVSRPLTGDQSGPCSSNDFWKVARVAFTATSTCTIAPIDTYVTSSAACSQL